MRHVGAVEIEGRLVSFPVPGRKVILDGFLVPGRRRHDTLLIYVHGMRSNFYSSRLKKAVFQRGAASDKLDVLLFNNRGAESGVETERFADSRSDIAAALEFGRSKGYRSFVLAGHSTGCQKTAYYLSATRDPRVRALALLAPCDDYAISRRDLGKKYASCIAGARRLVAAGRGDTRLPDCLNFTARRFLSASERSQTEAALFDYDGPMKRFRQLVVPMLVLFGTREEYACRPVREMIEILAACTASDHFAAFLLSGGDHGFHGLETDVADRIVSWAEGWAG